MKGMWKNCFYFLVLFPSQEYLSARYVTFLKLRVTFAKIDVTTNEHNET